VISQPAQQRKPRFKRAPTQDIQLTPRDMEALRYVFEHRFLRSTHLIMLLGGSAQGVLRRLNLLYHHGFLDRLKGLSPLPMVYALGDRGADLLERLYGIPRGKVDWTLKNAAIDPVSLFRSHTLLVADVMVRLEIACRKQGGVRIITAEEILRYAPEETQEAKNPLGWNVIFSHEGERVTLGVIPDKIFGLHFTALPGGKNKAYFFLEADRGTMPVIRKNLKQTSFYKKLLTYYETWQQGLHTKQYNIKNFRVLMVTSSPERVENLIAANKQIGDGRGSPMFLFTHERAVEECDNLLALEWRNGLDEARIRLVPVAARN
jgi:hypothetical protein